MKEVNALVVGTQGTGNRRGVAKLGADQDRRVNRDSGQHKSHGQCAVSQGSFLGAAGQHFAMVMSRIANFDRSIRWPGNVHREFVVVDGLGDVQFAFWRCRATAAGVADA